VLYLSVEEILTGLGIDTTEPASTHSLHVDEVVTVWDSPYWIKVTVTG
jgi:hypothetical protein